MDLLVFVPLFFFGAGRVVLGPFSAVEMPVLALVFFGPYGKLLSRIGEPRRAARFGMHGRNDDMKMLMGTVAVADHQRFVLLKAERDERAPARADHLPFRGILLRVPRKTEREHRLGRGPSRCSGAGFSL